MPILTRLARNLSPLEEVPAHVNPAVGLREDMSGVRTTGAGSSMASDEGVKEGESAFVEIGMSILTTRKSAMCDSGGSGGDGQKMMMAASEHTQRPRSLQECEIFEPINDKTLTAMKTEMQHLWLQGIPMNIEVKGQAIPVEGVHPHDGRCSLLLEQWTIQVLPKRPQGLFGPIQLLPQAVKSYLHFSQIRSWMVANKGRLPFQLLYRVCAPGEENEQFTLQTRSHTFPSAVFSQHYTMLVSVRTLPRLDHVPSVLLPPDNRQSFHRASKQLDGRQSQYNRTEWSTGSNVTDRESLSTANRNVNYASLPLVTNSSLDTPSRVTGVDSLIHKTSAISITSSPTSKPLSCHRSQVRHAPKLKTESTSTSSPHSASSDHLLQSREGFPFSPPQPSPMSPKLLSGLGDKMPYSELREARQMGRSRSHANDHHPCNTSWELRDEDCLHSQHFCFESDCIQCRTHTGYYQPAHSHSELGVSPSLSSNQASRSFQRSESCNYPSSRNGFDDISSSSCSTGGVCPPSASSPVPFNTHNRRVGNENKRRSLAINIKRPYKTLIRSSSAPVVVPKLCLLGTFEESVLNGRLEPCGYVEGFTAEIGASGSFCPRHLTLPVTAAFFSLHAEHDGTSPYLGQIDLTEVGKKGYHVPKKGTVQVTLLNPNKTVVKIYFVKYDFYDMPPHSQTFLRHKTLSRPCHPTDNPSIPALHYLIHLRFLCSKSGRVYLHKDIRLIFARRAPDTDPDLSKVSLYTVTEGPTDPKYGLIQRPVK